MASGAPWKVAVTGQEWHGPAPGASASGATAVQLAGSLPVQAAVGAEEALIEAAAARHVAALAAEEADLTEAELTEAAEAHAYLLRREAAKT